MKFRKDPQLCQVKISKNSDQHRHKEHYGLEKNPFSQTRHLFENQGLGQEMYNMSL